ncbi:MAG: UDP-2,3-diacylglucosamine diphosphatase LpxI [Leptospiraceae bacterium]|nr:UDP-2,3-diacylglucosamine diphosphatase LpxI [Leptospiraceae bacterium]
MGRLGIIAGAGELPHLAMQEAISENEDPIFLSIKESDFQVGKFNDRNIPIHITKIGSVIKTCKKNNIDRILLLGKVNKDILLKSYKFDLKTIFLLAKMLNQNDYTFFQIGAQEFLKNKITILSQKTYLKSLLLTGGRYTKKKLNKNELIDIEYGMGLARELARLDLGQTVAVMNRMALSLEAIEGTDEAIRRGGQLSKNKGATVCKSAKSNQDERFDLPTVGINTLNIMKEFSYKTLAIQARETIVVNPVEFIRKANELSIHFFVYDKNEDIKILNKKQVIYV